MNKYELKEAINHMRNKVVDKFDARSFATRIIMSGYHGGRMEHRGGIIVNEELDIVFVVVPKSQHRKEKVSYTVSFTRYCDDIITVKAPVLPIPNGIYRGRRKDGKFTMIAYFDTIMVDIGCDYRGEIKIIDPFWIDLRSIKVEEHKSPRQREREERDKVYNDTLDLEAKMLVANRRISCLEEENRKLEAELNALKDDAGNPTNDGDNDNFSDLADKSGW